MAGCGYVCPVCEGKGLDHEGNSCDYCAHDQPSVIKDSEEKENSEIENNSGN